MTFCLIEKGGNKLNSLLFIKYTTPMHLLNQLIYNFTNLLQKQKKLTRRDSSRRRIKACLPCFFSSDSFTDFRAA